MKLTADSAEPFDQTQGRLDSVSDDFSFPQFAQGGVPAAEDGGLSEII
jgi:hypothetical protein